MKVNGEIKNKILSIVKKNKYILAVILAGVVIMLLPTGKNTVSSTETAASDVSFSVEAEEKRLERLLSEIDGVGDVTVLLTVSSEGRKVAAVNTEESTDGDQHSIKTEPVVIEADGSESVAVLETVSAVFSGAVVVAEGAENAQVRLKITEAVKAATGLGSDKITVIN